MLTQLLKAKIHQAVVTFTDVNYHGSITIDADLLRASGLLPNEAVIVADCENGNRFTTYVIRGDPGSGAVGVNGAAARLTQVGHRVIVMSFVQATPQEAAAHRARVVLVDRNNRVTQTIDHPSTLDGQPAPAAPAPSPAPKH
jgi:aspartate 1-decarboxylase